MYANHTISDIPTDRKTSLKNRFLNVRNFTETLCEPLATEDYIPQPIVDVSPPRWHLAHTTWFFETFLLKEFKNKYAEYHPTYSYLFNSYYQNVGERWQRMERGHLTRPTVKEIYEYRKAINDAMINLIDSVDENKWDEFEKITILGLNHEQQHQELLLTDLKYILCRNPLFPVYNIFKDPFKSEKSPLPDDYYDFVEMDEGITDVGYKKNGFHFDNERPVQKVFLHNYHIRKGLVTNREYMDFMEDGGYENFRHWLMEGWEYITHNNIKAPEYWKKFDKKWQQVTLNGLKEIDPEAPVTHISYYEAEAFATWAGYRLPTEFEWEHAATFFDMAKNKEALNFQETKNFHPLRPQNMQQPLYQMLGDVWEWTSSAYAPYHSYKAAEGALGEYNGKFMVNQMVLRGGSCATPSDHIRISYRNFFHPDKRWQFSGIRLAK